MSERRCTSRKRIGHRCRNEPDPGYATCAACRAYNRTLASDRRMKLRGGQKARPTFCGRCHRRGHNARANVC